MRSPGIDRVTQLVALFTMILVAGLLAGGWVFHASMSEAFETARRQALRDQGALVLAAIEQGLADPAAIEDLGFAAGLDRLEILDADGRRLRAEAPSFPPATPLPQEDASLGLEYAAEPLRDGDELYLTLYLPLEDESGQLKNYLLLEAGARLSDQLIHLRRGLWIATGAGALFVSFVLLSMALILRQARRRQRELDRAEHLAEVGTLAAGLAHEIRNPLAIILGHSELLEMEASGKDAERAVEIIEETERLRRLLDDFLHYARPTELRLKKTDLGALWTRAIEEAKALHPGTVFRRVAEGGPRVADCDPDRIRQIALNLLGNAASFSPEGGEVLVTVEGDKTELRVRVRDQGPGVDPDLRDKLFEPFVSGREGGTGLGLALSRSLARAHGGDLRLADSSTEGSTFELILPFQSKGITP